MPTDTDEIIPTRHSLLQKLKNWEDNSSWKDFFDTYWKLIYGVARKAGLNDSEAQDVVQETIISVAQKMPAFNYDPELGSFKAWLLRLTRWRIADQFRKKVYERQGKQYVKEEPLTEEHLQHLIAQEHFDIVSAWDEEWEKHIFETALQRVKERVTPSEFQVFHLHVIKGRSAREVAALLNIKLPAVYFIKYKVSAQLSQLIKSLGERMK